MTDAAIARTVSGTLLGTTIDTDRGPVHRFAGVPFGVAPVDAGRFRRADPAPPWSGERPADRVRAVAHAIGRWALQRPRSRNGGDAGRRGLPDAHRVAPGPPGRTSRCPVMVWVYGGAFVTGGNGLATYDGARLCAEQGVIVVTVNYRIGALGFLDLRSLPGGDTADTNCGLRDQVLALQWVQRHIAPVRRRPGARHHLRRVGRRRLDHAPADRARDRVAGAAGHRAEPGHRLHPDRRAERRRGPGVRGGGRGHERRRAAGRCHRPASSSSRTAVAAELLFDVGTMVFHPGGRRRRRAGDAVGRPRRRRGERRRPPDGLHRRRDAPVPRSACRRRWTRRASRPGCGPT